MRKIMMDLLRNKKLFLAGGLIYTIVLLTLSLVRLNESSLPFSEVGNADKIFHFCAYLGLTLIWQFYYFTKTEHITAPKLWICGLIIMFGIVIELLQLTMTAYRSFEGLDIVANTSGVILAFVILQGWRSIRKFKTK